MPYKQKPLRVERSWLERLFSLSWFTPYKTVMMEVWEQPEPLVRSTAGYPRPTPSPYSWSDYSPGPGYDNGSSNDSSSPSSSD